MTPLFAELFAGAGGLSLGLERAGWSCAWHAEIAPAPRAILAHRWPDVPLYGDVTTLDGRALTGTHGAIDLLTGGSPCQDLSVAGKRAGMTEGSGTRSSLFFEQMRLWDETGAGLCLWENVDGARSSNEGRDFGSVLRAFVGAAIAVPSDGWRSAGVAAGPAGVAAWRVLDAQFFGVPQRRRRVFVLGTRTGRVDPAEVLSLAESVRGDSAPRREAREGAACDAARGVAIPVLEVGKRTGVSTTDLRAGSGIGDDGDPMYTLQAGAQHGVLAVDGEGNGTDGTFGCLNAHHSSHNRGAVLAFDTTNQTVGDVAHTLRDPHGTFGDALPAVFAFNEEVITNPVHRGGVTEERTSAITPAGRTCIAYGIGSHAGAADGDVTNESHASGGPTGFGITEELSNTLRAGRTQAVCLTGDVTHSLTHEGHDASEDGTGRGTPIVAFNETGHEKWTEEPIAGSLNAHEAREAHTIIGTLNGSQRQQVDGAMTAQHGIPRRLMPIECERLMSWPDGHTLVPDANGKLLSDAARYKACGNGVASVHSHWIGWRLAELLMRERVA